MQKIININQNEWHKLNQFKQFETVELMDQDIKYHSKGLNKGQCEFLQLLSRYSCFSGRIGVCWRKNDELSTELNKCKRTIIRYTKQLVEKGVIKIVKTLKANGRQGANIFIIQPSTNENVTLKSASNQGKTERMSLLIKAESKIINTIRKEVVSEPTVEQLDHSFVPNHIPSEFVKAAKPFFNASTIYKLWGKVLLAARISRIDDIESLMHEIIQQFKATVFLIKKGRIRDLMGYWYSGVYAIFVQHQRRKYKPKYNWLVS